MVRIVPRGTTWREIISGPERRSGTTLMMVTFLTSRSIATPCAYSSPTISNRSPGFSPLGPCAKLFAVTQRNVSSNVPKRTSNSFMATHCVLTFRLRRATPGKEQGRRADRVALEPVVRTQCAHYFHGSQLVGALPVTAARANATSMYTHMTIPIQSPNAVGNGSRPITTG
jgi:hypothetical protein